MFETMTDRIAGTVLMGLDVAVEFATLGEYRLVEADLSPAPDSFQALPLVRRPERMTAGAPDRRLLPPASTAIARAAAASAARVASRRTVVPSAPRRRSIAPVHGAAKRQRAGAVEAGTQLCLFGR